MRCWPRPRLLPMSLAPSSRCAALVMIASLACPPRLRRARWQQARSPLACALRLRCNGCGLRGREKGSQGGGRGGVEGKGEGKELRGRGKGRGMVW